MIFGFFKKRRKYPFNKQEAPKAVYAGPEYFRRRGGQDRDEGEVLDVYAGPEYFEREPSPEDPGEASPPPEEVPAAVYAGPEPPRERGALIYAGPEFFAGRRQKAQADALAAGIYAGPEPPVGGMTGAPVPHTPSQDEGKADGEG